MEKDIAIKVENVSKTFRIPHEKISSLRGAAVNAFKKKSYEEFQALDDVSFEVKKGEFFGIIGRNGSGKSTLLKILAGIYQPDKGKVHIDGLISPFLELGIGFNPELSGRDNVYLNATVLGMSRKQIDQKFNDIVAFSELERFIDQKLKNYSSGMQVRLAFSVAIHANRDILLMDEVLAVGDSNFQSKCLEEFNKYRDMGKTVILVTHDISTIQKYCDRAVLLRAGKIVQIGNAEEVGNAYIYQNMSDEEKRLHDNQKSINKNVVAPIEVVESESTHKKSVTITGIGFHDSSGEKKTDFSTGDDIEIRIEYFADIKVKNPVFGVSIDTSDKVHIIGQSTRNASVKVSEIFGGGQISLILNKCNLNKGIYYVTFGIFSWDESVTYDFKTKMNFFQINIIDKTQDSPFKTDILWNI